MITYSPIGFDRQSLLRYELLFSECFPKSRKFGSEVLYWLYAENPVGTAIGFDAFDDENLAGHYVCIPATIRINGKPEKALLSLNTATRPAYQGKGLFTKLAEMTYQAAADQNFAGIYGVANANSTPGFTKKLGFQLVQPLDAKVGFGRLGIDLQMAHAKAQFERVWTPASIEWRSRNPVNRVRNLSLEDGDGIGFYANAFGKSLSVYAEIAAIDGFNNEKKPMNLPFHLFLGLVPEDVNKFKSYVDIPYRLRPSPLNLIYRSLTPASATRLDAGHINFSFLDFDAY